MKRKLIKRSKKWLTKIYKSASYLQIAMYKEIEFRTIANHKRNIARIQKRYPSSIDWLNIKFYEGYVEVPCFDRYGDFAYDVFLYSKEQLPYWLTPYWIPFELLPVD